MATLPSHPTRALRESTSSLSRRLARAGLLAAILLSGCAAFSAAPEVSLEAELSRIFAPWLDPDSAGAAVVVIRDGETLFRRGFGAADAAGGAAIRPRTTVFSIASVTKQFTAFGVLLLAEDGRLDLDAEVRRYLPWFPDFGAPITLRHLMHHTSGLREYSILATLRGERYRDERPFRQENGLALVAAQRELNFTPGTDLLYTNTNYTLLAEVIAAVSGRSYQSFLHEAVFQPLGMESTTVQGPDASTTGYIGEKAYRGMHTWGESGVLTTADDLATWARHLLSPRYRPGATRRLFEKGRLSDGTELDYAGGLLYGTAQGVQTVGHGGSLPFLGFVADLILVPSRDLAVVILGNARDAVDRGAEVLEALLPEAAEPEPDTAKLSPDGYEAWAGR
ncbi:MAG: beta-lactamase family protein, partial [Holophagales bacterium]|nr:beta-lactamase family protein [Holophagales bacterium]